MPKYIKKGGTESTHKWEDNRCLSDSPFKQVEPRFADRDVCRRTQGIRLATKKGDVTYGKRLRPRRHRRLGYDLLVNHLTRLAALAVILVCTVCAAAHAEGEDQNPQGQQPATTAPPPKEPPPPLFPKHRRGTYKNSQGFDVVDATPQSPPLDTDDPNVPGKGEWEINLTTLADVSKEAHRVDLLLVDVNYGIVPKIAGHELPTQVKFEFPVAAARTNDDPFTFGVGAVKLGLKFNFYNNEHTGLSVSAYPQVAFAPPGGGAVEKGLAEPGHTWILPLLVTKEFHHFTFVANGGIEDPVHVPEGDLTGTFGVSFGRAITNPGSHLHCR